MEKGGSKKAKGSLVGGGEHKQGITSKIRMSKRATMKAGGKGVGGVKTGNRRVTKGVKIAAPRFHEWETLFLGVRENKNPRFGKQLAKRGGGPYRMLGKTVRGPIRGSWEVKTNCQGANTKIFTTAQRKQTGKQRNERVVFGKKKSGRGQRKTKSRKSKRTRTTGGGSERWHSPTTNAEQPSKGTDASVWEKKESAIETVSRLGGPSGGGPQNTRKQTNE